VKPRLRLILVRHGETQPNRDGRILGVSDVPLTPTGRAQANAIAGVLREDLPFRLYTSPIGRASETARAISASLAVPLASLEGLAEADAGELEGLTGREMRRQYPEFARRWDEDPGTAQMPGGESLSEVQRRAWSAVRGLLTDHPDETVVAVTHNFTIQTIVCEVLDMPLRNFRKLRQDIGSITRIELTDSSMTVEALNQTGHLKALASEAADAD
jgi:broad specificity phosphatase PhoE